MTEDDGNPSNTLHIIERTLSALGKMAEDDEREFLSYLIEIARLQCEEEAGRHGPKDTSIQ